MSTALPQALKTVGPTAWVWMDMAAQETRVIYAAPGSAMQERVLSMGTRELGNGPFRTAPPGALALENAIASVEDALMPLVKDLPAQARFFASSEGLQDMLEAHTLEIAQLEDRFNDLAAHAQGRPFANNDLRIQPEGAAQLLILREAMHHLGFASVQILER